MLSTEMLSVLFEKKLLFVVLAVVSFLATGFAVQALTFEPTVTLEPALLISSFSPYKVKVTDVPSENLIQSMSLNLSVADGDATGCWRYLADGSCVSSAYNMPMTYNSTDSNWQSPNIYPDYIYPQVEFASSSITWYNSPLEAQVRRNDYQLMHLTNPFHLEDEMYLFLELNVIPSAANSSNLEVYLVGKNKPVSTFNVDWRTANYAEMVGTLLSTDTYGHAHSLNSRHFVIPLNVNADGTVGTKHLDVSGDLWIVLYAQSPNTARSWKMRYQPDYLCNQTNRWYAGNIQGWTTTAKTGCPDVHFHVARAGAYQDSVKSIITATYVDGGVTTAYQKTANTNFQSIANLPPTGSSFNTPALGSSISGTAASVSWNPATDPNGSAVTYTVNLMDATGTTVVANLVTGSSSPSLVFNTTLYTDGVYSLKGQICDDGVPGGNVMCTVMNLGGTFDIQNTATIYSLSSVALSSTGSGNIVLKTETVYLDFVSTGTLVSPSVKFYSGGVEIISGITLVETTANHWRASFTAASNHTSGELSFDITAPNLDYAYSATTDASGLILEINNGHIVINLPVSLAVSSANSWVDDLSQTASTGTVLVGVRPQNSAARIASFNSLFAGNLDFSTVRAGTYTNKAFFHTTSTLSAISGGASSSYTLFVPKSGGDHVWICPGASSFSEINLVCSGGYSLVENETKNIGGVDVTATVATESDGVTYWKIAGLTSTGGMSYLPGELSDTLSRLEAGIASNHTIIFTTNNGVASGESITFEFSPGVFDVSDITTTDILFTDFAETTEYLFTGANPWQLSKAANTITFTAPGVGFNFIAPATKVLLKIGTNATAGVNQIVNPASAGVNSLQITLNTANPEGASIAIPIVDSDQVEVTSFINTFINFDIDTGLSDAVNCAYSACLYHENGTAASNYTVDLGELNSTWINASQAVSVRHSDGADGLINSIYFDLTTNAYNGAILYVKSANGGLQGPGTNLISSVTNDGDPITANSGTYGFRLPSAGTGNGTINLAACTSVGVYCALSVTENEVFNTAAAPLDGGRVRMDIAAAASYTNNPGSYTDTLTFIAVGTF